ncbi:hypothetical protein [Burkholderia gladioli]|uniref:hypothetical protein n=1 Tax=Burkholderia gladioli TaxID=28095 RepID=UPI00163EC7A0|nr:hypothetical protein [Burkholderia gladioli]
MNCKPGDLAIITRGREVAGRIVEVISPCPRNIIFQLPDGCSHHPVDYEWIVKFQNPVIARLSSGGTRKTYFAPVPDRVLRPISGVPVTDDIEDEVPA